ncbi:hypothetical protein VMCG_04899 [Cytospora schulzeri]|uniref:2EXR domain-containing protein n=1 Tax=Cytospora schulzeri TaxID=448051 RepID=A0A423WN80_9PEZI|nr:hypothetical protein VMCG_04899 [Valsa malicola]
MNNKSSIAVLNSTLKATPQERTFHLFPSLPKELRLQIWEEAVPRERLIRVYLRRGEERQREPPPRYLEQNHLGKLISGPRYTATAEGHKINSKFLRVNKEAREVALAFHRVHLPFSLRDPGTNRAEESTLYLNPEHDILHIDADAPVRETLIDFFWDLKAYDPRGVGLVKMAIDLEGFCVNDLQYLKRSDLLLIRQRNILVETLSQLNEVWFVYVDSGRSRSSLTNIIPIAGSISTFDRLGSDPRKEADTELSQLDMGRIDAQCGGVDLPVAVERVGEEEACREKTVAVGHWLFPIEALGSIGEGDKLLDVGFRPFVALVLIWGFHYGAYLDPATPGERKSYFDYKSGSKSPLSPHVHTYFEQVFSTEKPPYYDFPALKAACARTEWKDENKDVFLECGGIQAGMTSIMSEVKVCFKMAIDAGVNMLLPSMPLRDSEDLLNFNLMNDSAYMAYDQWFDQDHLLSSMARACPRMKINHPMKAGTESLPVANRWSMDIGTAPGFQMLLGYFWVGRPFKAWFDKELVRLRFLANAGRKSATDEETSGLQRSITEEGATIISIDSQFLLFRVTDDPTGREVALWNDLSHLIRFRKEPRVITNRILSHIDRPFFGVHFRVEKDNIWSSFENQLKLDLDALEQAWAQYGSPGKERPLIYLACGDEGQIDKFSQAVF